MALLNFISAEADNSAACLATEQRNAQWELSSSHVCETTQQKPFCSPISLSLSLSLSLSRSLSHTPPLSVLF